MSTAEHSGKGAETSRVGPRTTGRERSARIVAAGGVLGALAAASCCVIPFALFALGVSGAWIGSLVALAPYQPYFVGATLVFLGAGFVMVYRKPRKLACGAGASCARPLAAPIVKGALWLASGLVALAWAWPGVAPILLDL